MNLKEYETVSVPLKIQIQSLEVRGINPDLKITRSKPGRAKTPHHTATMGARSRAQRAAGTFLRSKLDNIADLAIKKRLP